MQRGGSALSFRDRLDGFLLLGRHGQRTMTLFVFENQPSHFLRAWENLPWAFFCLGFYELEFCFYLLMVFSAWYPQSRVVFRL